MRLLLRADARAIPLRDESVNCVVTSPPYWGLRDYGVPGQLGLERTPEEYVARMVEVFREVRRVLRPDGTLWMNMGDGYAANRSYQVPDSKHVDVGNSKASSVPPGLKPKDLVGIPWRLAFALQADGWWLRSDIVWAKKNCMPESVTDRPTRSHEYVFLLSKRATYYYDAEAITEESVGRERFGNWIDGRPCPDRNDNGHQDLTPTTTRNRRSVWTIATQPYPDAHFATYPEDLVRPCVRAGCPKGGIVFDPFVGSGTTVKVAVEEGRRGVGMDLSAKYLALAARRTAGLTAPFPECA